MRADFVILGGGIAGLTAARELARRGHRVVLAEKGDQVGGLARTIEDRGFRFDIGGHRFHSTNPSVVRWLHDLLGSDVLTVPRRSHILIEERFAHYPLVLPGALRIFSPARAARMLGSYLLGRITERHRPDDSFEDWVIRRYGRALYEVFFEPYTEKVWGIPCRELSAQWAEQRIGIPSAWRALKHLFFPPPETLPTAVRTFHYPRRGFGMIPDALAREFVEMGGTLHTGTSLMQLVPRQDGAMVTLRHSSGLLDLIDADHVVSTLPMNALLAAIPDEYGSREIESDAQLEYRDMIVLMMALDRKQVSTDSWTYFPARELIFGRTHEPKNWSSEMVPSDQATSLVVEIFSTRGEPLWLLPDEELTRMVIEQMAGIGWIRAADVRHCKVMRVPFAYPVYRLGYERRLARVKGYLGQWPHLHLVGRTGSFRYLNSDGVVEDVFRFLEEMETEIDREIDNDRRFVIEPLAAQAGRWR